MQGLILHPAVQFPQCFANVYSLIIYNIFQDIYTRHYFEDSREHQANLSVNFLIRFTINMHYLAYTLLMKTFSTT